MARLTISLSDPEHTNDVASISIDAAAFSECKDQDCLRRVVSNLFFELLKTTLKSAEGKADGEQIHLEETRTVKL